FDGLGVGSTFLTATLSGFDFSSTSTFSSGNLTVLANPGGTWPASPADLLAQKDSGGNSNGSIVINVPANIFAIALFTSYAIVQDDMNFAITAGGVFNRTGLNIAAANPYFLGFRSDTAI